MIRPKLSNIATIDEMKLSNCQLADAKSESPKIEPLDFRNSEEAGPVLTLSLRWLAFAHALKVRSCHSLAKDYFRLSSGFEIVKSKASEYLQTLKYFRKPGLHSCRRIFFEVRYRFHRVGRNQHCSQGAQLLIFYQSTFFYFHSA